VRRSLKKMTLDDITSDIKAHVTEAYNRARHPLRFPPAEFSIRVVTEAIMEIVMNADPDAFVSHSDSESEPDPE